MVKSIVVYMGLARSSEWLARSSEWRHTKGVKNLRLVFGDLFSRPLSDALVAIGGGPSTP